MKSSPNKVSRFMLHKSAVLQAFIGCKATKTEMLTPPGYPISPMDSKVYEYPPCYFVNVLCHTTSASVLYFPFYIEALIYIFIFK